MAREPYRVRLEDRGQRTGNGLSPGVRKALREDDIPELSCMGWTGVGQTRKGDGALSRGTRE